MQSLTPSYQDLLSLISANPKPFRSKELVAFHPMVGPAKTTHTMFIGRALNGWHWSFTPEDLLRNPENILDSITSDKHQADTYDERLDWVDRCWGAKEGYNSAKSQFWQVVKSVSTDQALPNQRWWDGIVWTNFAKIAPTKRNPTAAMTRVLGSRSLDLLLHEIQTFKPRNVVCLSGLAYAANLLAAASTTNKLEFQPCLLEYAGDVTWYGSDAVRLLIAPQLPRHRKRNHHNNPFPNLQLSRSTTKTTPTFSYQSS
jgi:hypothetical protein